MLSGHCLEVYSNFISEFVCKSSLMGQWPNAPGAWRLDSDLACLLSPPQGGVFTAHFLAPHLHTPPTRAAAGWGPGTA